MKLDEWMLKNDMSQTDLANSLNTYPNRVHSLLKGKYKPTPDFAKKIRSFTKNQVTLDDLYDIPTHEEQEMIKATRKRQQAIDISLESMPEDVLDLVCKKLIKLMEGKIDKPKELEVEQPVT